MYVLKIFLTAAGSVFVQRRPSVDFEMSNKSVAEVDMRGRLWGLGMGPKTMSLLF